MSAQLHSTIANTAELASGHGLFLTRGRFQLDNLVYERPLSLASPCVLSHCRIGAYTYLGGGINAAKTKIGRYCSVATRLHTLVTPPREGRFANFPLCQANNPFGNTTSHATLTASWCGHDEQDSAPLAYQITIGNDVWIGDNVSISTSSEIKVGDGVIIGANAVVTQSIPPYAIVAGNPARILRQRFSDTIVAELMQTRWWDFDLPACFAAHGTLLSTDAMRNPESFLPWWKEQGRDLLQCFPLSTERRQISLNNNSVQLRTLEEYETL